MWYNLLANIADKTRTATPWEAAVYALLGFAVVFIGISFLIFVVWLVGKIMSKTTKPKAKQEPSAVLSIEEPKEEELSDEVVAVIMAALTAYYEQNNPKCEFTVKRIKRI